MEHTPVFLGGAYGQTQTAGASRQTAAVTHYHTVEYQIVVDSVGIRHLGQQEIGIGRIHMLDTGAFGQLAHQHVAVIYDAAHHAVYVSATQAVDNLALCGSVDIIGILHPCIEFGDARVRNSHAYTQAGHAPRFGKRLEHYEIGVGADGRLHRARRREVHVSLINHHHAVKPLAESQDVSRGKGIAGRIVRAAYPHQFRVGVGSFEQLVDRELEIFGQLHLAQLHVIDSRTYSIDSVARGDGDGRIS